MILSLAAVSWSASLAATATWAAIQTRRGRLSGAVVRAVASGQGRVLLLRPCAGDERHLERALRSSRLLDGCAIRFLVAGHADPVLPAIERVRAELVAQGRDAQVRVTGASAPNMKVAQLARALEGETADVIVIADSDVELSLDAVRALLAPLASGEAEAAWVPPVETAPSTMADRASASVLDASLHAFPLLAGIDRSGMVGKLFAVRRVALEAVGGFASLTDRLGEDVELARRLRARGLRVRACPAVAASLAAGRSWREVVRRYARWIAVVRAQRPSLLASYPLLFAATPSIVALALLATVREGAGGLVALAFALVARFAVAVLARLRAERPVQPARVVFDGLVADGVLLAAFATAMTTREVEWRGRRLALAPRGLVERGR
jgi:ceramide glucosyltransferase